MPRKIWETAKEFAQRLISVRKRRGLTQMKLAELSGVSQRAISYYESQGIYPPAPVVVQLAHVLNLSTDELLGVHAIQAKPATLSEQPRKSPRIQRLWKRFQMVLELPERDQRAVIRLILSLTKAKTLAKRCKRLEDTATFRGNRQRRVDVAT